MKCLICSGNTDIKNTICNHCLSLFDEKHSPLDENLVYIDKAYGAYHYNRLLKESILKYKFGNKRYLSKLFGELLTDMIVERKLYRDVDLLISVPLHKKVLGNRGYNQVELLEDIVSQSLNIPGEKKNLIKITHTREQARLSISERRENLKDVFDLKSPSRVVGKSILLLDDIITTGSTIEECGKVLKNAGAKYIVAVSIGVVH